MADSFVQDGQVVKTCIECNEDRQIAAFMVEEGEDLSAVCCYCENHEDASQGLDLESRPFGERLADGFEMMGDN